MSAIMNMKRKFEELEIDGSHVDYTCQRQSILDISMCKLKQPLVRRVEPSLRRSVLIFNTLKYIENELRVEGLAAPTKILPSIEDNTDMTLDPPPPVDYNLPVTEMDCSGAQSSPVFPFPKSSMPQNSVMPTNTGSRSSYNTAEANSVPSSGCEPVYPQTSTSSGHSLLDISCNVSHSSVPFNNATSQIQHTTPVPLTSYSSADALSDIDSSLLDFEFIRSCAPSTKLSPLSTDDLIHAFPSTVSSVPYTESYNVQCYKNDLLSDDLDNIMQILVGM